MSMNIEELVETGLGNFGYKQLIQALLVSLPLFFDAQQAFISVFTDKQPSWHCVTRNCNSSTSNICDLSKDSWSWDVPYYKSVVSEWNLQCSTSSFSTGLPASSFFMGSLVGGFALSTLADSTLGRKNMLFLSSLTMSVASVLSSLSMNVWIYSVLRFVSGFFRASVLSCSLVLLMETVAKERRGQLSLIGFLCFSIGTISLPAIAYNLDNNVSSSWRSLYLWTSIPSMLYCVTAYFFVEESPRWLFLLGYEAEAIEVLDRLNSSSSTHHIPVIKENSSNYKPWSVNSGSSVKELLKRRWAWQRLVNVTTLAFGIGVIYFGLFLGVDGLDFDIYLSTALNGVMDIPAYCVSYVLIERCGRRSSILVFCMLSGLCCMLMCIPVIGNALELGIELMSLFNVCVAFNVMLIYATEMFPTNVRNTASAIVRQAVNLGAAVGPLLVSAGRINRFFSYGVFGIVIIGAGLVVIWLPETQGMCFYDTLDEQEQNER